MSPVARRGITVHASCVVLLETGILIRGPSGAGKSRLARHLVTEVSRSGRFAALVADDRVVLGEAAGRVVARPVPGIAGLLEIRGIGIVPVACEPACVLRLVVDLVAPANVRRLPEPDECRADLLGTTLPRIAVCAAEALDLILWQIRDMHDTSVTE